MNLSLTYVENPKTCGAFFRVTCEEKGITTVKNLTVEETLRLLGKSSYENEVKYYDPGEKPYGYVKHFASDRADTFKIALLYPAKKRGVKYFNDTYFVPYPNVLYIYEVRKGYVQTKRCFAVKDKEIKPDTKLYRFPFGNVTGDTGSMCYGNIKFPKLHLRFVHHNISKHFPSAPFNEFRMTFRTINLNLSFSFRHTHFL